MSAWLHRRLLVDRVLAALMLVLLSPVIAVAAVRVRSDGGPAFVRVPRVGRGGAPFGMCKLRTMRADRPGGLAGGGSIARGDVDDRVTPLGRRLRRARIDELPNLVNVIRGEMALIGPRPEAPDYVRIEDERWEEVLAVPPGLVGPTQLLVEAWEAEVLEAEGIDAYGAKVLPVKLTIDRWYVRSASARVDGLIVSGLIGWLRGANGSRRRLRAMVAHDVGPALDAVPE